MTFFLMILIAAVPFILGIAIMGLFGKTRITKALFLFLCCMTVWQIDVSILYAGNFMKLEWIDFLFRFFRIGSIMLMSAFFYMGYVLYSAAPVNLKMPWLSYVMNKKVVTFSYIWCFIVYIIGWTNYGVSGFTEIYQVEGVQLLYPEYGSLSAIFEYHIRGIIVSIILSFIASLRVENTHLRSFLRTFIITYIVTYAIGVQNLKPTTFVYSGQLSVMFSSIVVFVTFVNMQSKMKKELSESTLRKGRMEQVNISTSGLIHELRNPLTAVKGFVDILPHIQPLTPEGKSIVDELKMAGDHMTEVIQNFSSFIKEEVNPETINFSEVIQNSIVLIRKQAEEKNIDVVFEDVRVPLILEGDKSKLRQVFINLIKNSIDAIEKDSVESKITITLFTQKNNVIVDIKDTGSGIPENKWLQIFKPFETTKSHTEGMGLGLAITQKIIHCHGGTINVLESDSNGTTIRVTIPRYFFQKNIGQ